MAGFIDWFKSKPIASKLSKQQTDNPQTKVLHREFDDHPSKRLTPAKLARIFIDAEQGNLISQAELFMDMEEKDAHISAELSKRKMAVKKLDWSLEPPRNASATEKKATKRLEDLIRDEINIGTVKSGMLDAIGHGYSCLELSWSQNDQELWVPKTIEHRPPTWFTCPQDDMNTLYLRSNGSVFGESLQEFGWIPHVHKSRSGYLARTGLHRVLAWPYLYKNYSVRDLAEFLEIYGVPIRIGKYPSNADAKAKRDLMQSVMSIGHNAAGIIPDTMQIELQTVMASGSTDAFKVMIDWCESSISKAILGGTLTSQTGSNGNRSLGDVHNEVRLDIRDDDAKQIDESLSSYLVYPIAMFNNMFADNRCPRFVSDTQEPDDLALFADAMPKLAAAGAKIPLSYIYRKLKIPEPEGDEPVLEIGKALPMPTQSDQTKSAVTGLSGIIETPGDFDFTPSTNYTNQLAEETAPTLTTWLSSINDLVQKAESLEALQTDLINHYGQLESQELTNVMALAFAAADLSGRYDVKGGA